MSDLRKIFSGSFIFFMMLSLNFVSPAFAGNGKVTSAPCPYNCKSLGIKKKKCKDWREGNTCYVQDLRKGGGKSSSGSNSPRYNKGRVSSTTCPHSCRSQGIPKSHCKDWKQGNTCFVEDLRYPPLPDAPAPPAARKPRPPVSGGDTAGCRKMDRYSMGTPRIDVSRIKASGNMFKSGYKVYGSFEGICLQEAGYFENGHLKQKFPVAVSRQFRRSEFEVKIRGDKNPEIRVYNVLGERSIYEIDTD